MEILGMLLVVLILGYVAVRALLKDDDNGPRPGPTSRSNGSDRLDLVDDMVLYDEVNPPDDDDLLS